MVLNCPIGYFRHPLPPGAGAAPQPPPEDRGPRLQDGPRAGGPRRLLLQRECPEDF